VFSSAFAVIHELQVDLNHNRIERQISVSSHKGKVTSKSPLPWNIKLPDAQAIFSPLSVSSSLPVPSCSRLLTRPPSSVSNIGGIAEPRRATGTARACRREGARLATNVPVQDPNLATTAWLDNWQSEVLAHAVP